MEITKGQIGCLILTMVLFTVAYLGVVGGLITLAWNLILVDIIDVRELSWGEGILIALVVGFVGKLFTSGRG